MFLNFFVLFVASVAAFNPRPYPVQREDFVRNHGNEEIPMPQHQPAGIYKVSRDDFVGAPEVVYPYPPRHYPAPRTHYWNPPRSYNYRNPVYDTTRPIIPGPKIPLFIPYSKSIKPTVTRKPAIVPLTPPENNDNDESVLPATRGLSPSDESLPLAAKSTNLKRVSTQPDEFYSYNDDVEITAEQRDLLVGFDRAFASEAKEPQKQADRFRRQAMFVIEATAEDTSLMSSDDGSSDDNRASVTNNDIPSDEFRYPASFYKLENNEIEDDPAFNQYKTTSSTPVVDSVEDLVVIYEQELIISSNDDLPESVARDGDSEERATYSQINIDFQPMTQFPAYLNLDDGVPSDEKHYALKAPSDASQRATPADDSFEAELRNILIDLLTSMPDRAYQQAGDFSRDRGCEDEDDVNIGNSRFSYDYESVETKTMKIEGTDEVDPGTNVCDELCLKFLSALTPQEASPSPSEFERNNEENSPDVTSADEIGLESTTIIPSYVTADVDLLLFNYLKRMQAAKESSTSAPIDATKVDDLVSDIDLLVSHMNQQLAEESATSIPIDTVNVIDDAALTNSNLVGFLNDQLAEKLDGILKQLDNGTFIYEFVTQSASTETTSISDFEPEEKIAESTTNSPWNTTPPTTTRDEDIYDDDWSSIDDIEARIWRKELDRQSRINSNIRYSPTYHWPEQTFEYDDESM